MSSFNFAESVEYIVDSFYNPKIFKSLLLMGNQGIGKSATVFAAAEVLRALGLKVRVIDKRTSTSEAADFSGIPYNDAGVMRFAKFDWFPSEKLSDAEIKKVVNKSLATLGLDATLGSDGVITLLFLDEINRAPRDVQQAIFQLVNDRCLDELQLSHRCVIVSAMNDNSELYQTTRMDPAFLDRFMMMQFKPSDTEWLVFMDAEITAGRGHGAVASFLKSHPTYIDPSNQMIEESTEKNTKTFSRRSWTVLSSMLKARSDLKEMDVKDWDLSYLARYCSGMVGVDAGTKLARFIENEYQTLDPKEVLKNYNEEMSKRIRKASPDEQIALTGEIVKIITEDTCKWGDKMQSATFHLLVDLVDDAAKKLIDEWNNKKGSQLLKFLRRTDLGEFTRAIGKDTAGNTVLKTYKKALERQTDLHVVEN